MILGVISDTHNRLPTINKSFKLFAANKVETVFHCGDWTTFETLKYVSETAYSYGIKVHGVIGNRDTDMAMVSKNSKLPYPIVFSDIPEHFDMTIKGMRIHMYHGHHKPTLAKLLKDDSYDILLTGHTHKPLIFSENKKLIINPGSTAFSIPRRREMRTIALLNITNRTAELIGFEA